jgi:hypothetical protein
MSAFRQVQITALVQVIHPPSSPSLGLRGLVIFNIPKVTKTMRELDRLKCIQELVAGHLRQHVVATRLGLTERQVRRLVR